MICRMNKRPRPVPATMADIARLAGVHASTVSRALTGSPLVEASKREMILKLAQEHGYTVNAVARNLRLKRTQTISVVIPLGHETSQTLTDPFFTTMLGELADAITQRGYGMFLQKILPPMDNWLQNIIASQRADGIIVIGQSTEHKALQIASRNYAPLVVWGGRLPNQTYCTVGTDNVGGARSAVEHLLAQGRKRIVFVGNTAVPEIKLRHDGYLAALSQAGKQVPDVVVPAHITAEAAYEAIRTHLAKHHSLDAIFAATDVIGLNALRALRAAGLTVPQDVAVVGFDDISLAAHSSPSLSTVRQNLSQGAHMLVDLLLRRIEGEDTPSATMAAELVVRESSTTARP